MLRSLTTQRERQSPGLRLSWLLRAWPHPALALCRLGSGQAKGAVQADDFAVDVAVVDNVLDKLGKVLGLAKPLGKRNLLPELVAHLRKAGEGACGVGVP